MKILIVEDDDILRKSLSFFLGTKGYEVVGFGNGLDAIEYLKNSGKEIRLVVTDLNLPFAGGQQVIHFIRENFKQEIRVIVLTSYNVEKTELEVFELGADEFVAKPFSPAVLLKRIEKLIPA